MMTAIHIENQRLSTRVYDIMMELFSTIYHKHKHLLLYRHSVVVVVFSLSLLLAQVEYYKV
jgi:Na+/proline symporter